MSRQLKVGLFVLLGLALAMFAVFLIGEDEHLWQSKAMYHTTFVDVAGLKAGSPVQLGGVDIGTVAHVAHSRDGADTRIHVKLSIVRGEAVRLRQGTTAGIVNKGLLGDKMVELKVPDPAAPSIPSGGEIKSEEPRDLTKYLEKFDKIADTAQATLNNVEAATRPFGDPKFSEDLKRSVDSLAMILEGVAHNDSAVHRLLMDPREGQRVDQLLADLDATSSHLDAVMTDVKAVTTQLRTGPGLAHALVYDGEVSHNAAGALEEVHKDLQAIREGNGIAHALIYGDDGQKSTAHVMSNLDAMSDDLRHIVGDIRSGKGTIGGLLVDPSVYEDIKSAVGNVERNEVLRALVRYSIKADEARPVPHVEPPAK